jgi:transposase
VAAKQIAVKKYVVKLSEAERQQLNALIRGGRHPAQQLIRARILLKADASEAGEGWSDSQIAAALDINLATVARTRQRLVEDGFDSVLTRKHSPNSARKRIFDGVAEAKLIALACSEPPKGRAKWTLRLLEDKVVERNIVDRVSDNTIGRTLKKLSQTAPEAAICHSAGRQRWLRGRHGRRSGSLSKTARSGLSRGLRGRDLEATGRRDP